MFDTGSITGEIIIFSGILASIFLGGVLAAVTKIRSERSVSKWAFQPTAASNANRQMEGTPIDLIQQAPIEVPLVTNAVEFEASDIEANVDLMSSIDDLLVEMKEDSIADSLERIKEQATFLIGENVAELITSTLENLPKEQAIIFGRYVGETNEIEMNGTSLSLSTTEELMLADGDLMLIRGQLLPNGYFRILHWDDAENVEAGYGREDFIIQLVS